MKVWHKQPIAEGITDIFIPSAAYHSSSKKQKYFVALTIVSDKYLASLLTTYLDLRPYPCTISSSEKTHTVVISGTRKTLRAVDILLHLIETSGFFNQETFESLKIYKGHLEKNLERSKPKPLPVKHKSATSYTTISQIHGKHLHQTVLASRRKQGKIKNYYLKQFDQDTACAEIEAFHADLYRLLLGTKHSPKVRVLVDKGKRSKLRSKEVPGYTSFASLLIKQRTAPKLELMIKAGCLEILAAAYVLAEDDLHSHNWGFDKNDNAIKIDHDGTAYPLSYVFHNSDLKHINKCRKTPLAFSFPITAKDMASFPYLNDAKPNNYPLSPDAIEYDLFKDVFTDVKKNPEAVFCLFKFFLKVSLISRNLIEQRARCHIRSAKKRKAYCDFHRKRFNKITKLLPSLEGFNNFMAANPQILTTLISEFESYNKSLKAQDAYLKLDISTIKKQFQQKYAKFLPTSNDISLIKNEMQQALIDKLRTIDDIEIKLITLENNTKEFFQNKADKTLLTDRFAAISTCKTKLTNYYQRIQSWPDKDHTAPYVITNELKQITLMADQLNIDLHNLPIINHALKLHRQIELMKRYYDLCEHRELNEPKKSLMLSWAAIDNIITFLNSRQTKNTEKLPDDIKAKLNAIEIVITGITFRLQRSQFSTDRLVKKTKDTSLNKTIAGINRFNALDWQVLNKKYPGTFFAKTKEKFYLREVITDYESKINELTQQLTAAPRNHPSKTLLERWQLRILKHIQKYYKPLGLNISSRRLNDLLDLFKIITTATSTDELKIKVRQRANNVETGWLFRSKLRKRVNQALIAPTLYRHR